MKLRSLIALLTLTLATASGCVLEVEADDEVIAEATAPLAIDEQLGMESEPDVDDAYAINDEDDAQSPRPDGAYVEPNIAHAGELEQRQDPDPTPWRLASDPGPDPWDGS